jgi:sarcosine oxidase, subunit beta
MSNNFDAIIIGGGSVGLPTAYYLSEKKLNVLVIEAKSQVGQGQNKSAIGGIRATHSDPTKIRVCQQSLDVYRNFTDRHKINIEWKQGGYCFPVFREKEEETLKGILPIQKDHDLKIDWVDAETVKEIVPGINNKNLRGGTYSPEDGDLSPLRTAYGWYRVCVRNGCKFAFNEEVIGIDIENGKVKAVKTEKDTYYADIVVNAAGAYAKQVGALTGLDLPVVPDSHEGGISSPVENFVSPLVVDLRPGPEGKTSNFYFAQNKLGQIIFCYTPRVLFKGTNRDNTSEFMPILARRLIDLMPRFKELLIRRTWRGLYPMTPDGSPIVDKVDEINGMYLAVGMCGQGLMLGPGVGINLAELITEGKPIIEQELFDKWKLKRSWAGKEALK